MTNLNITDRDIEVLPNLHLCSLVLEPELDLSSRELQLSAKFLPLLFVGMRTFFENADPINDYNFVKLLYHTTTHSKKITSFCSLQEDDIRNKFCLKIFKTIQ